MSHDPRGPEPGDTPPPQGDAVHRLPRREFLRRVGTVSALAAAAGWGALALRDPDGERGKPKRNLLRLPEGGYAVAPSAVLPTIGIARGDRIEEMVRGAIDLVGGISRFVVKGDVVVIKPNVAFERAAVLGATTNPEVLTALIKVVREAGAAEVRVADNPIESPESCFMRTGIHQAAVDAGAHVYLPMPGQFETLEVPGAKWIGEWPFFAAPFRGATKVIGVAPVKDHNLCRASLTTKNWYGLLGGRRNQFHQDIHGIITDLATMMRPTFVLLDGSRILFRSGPTGGSLSDVKAGRTIAAATDTLAVDAFAWDALLERSGEEKPAYLAMAAAKGLGNPDWRSVLSKEVQVG